MKKYTKTELQALQDAGRKVAEKYNEFIREYIVAKRQFDLEKLGVQKLKEFKEYAKKNNVNNLNNDVNMVTAFLGNGIAKFNTEVFGGISNICLMFGITQEEQDQIITRFEKENEDVKNGKN